MSVIRRTTVFFAGFVFVNLLTAFSYADQHISANGKDVCATYGLLTPEIIPTLSSFEQIQYKSPYDDQPRESSVESYLRELRKSLVEQYSGETAPDLIWQQGNLVNGNSFNYVGSGANDMEGPLPYSPGYTSLNLGAADGGDISDLFGYPDRESLGTILENFDIDFLRNPTTEINLGDPYNPETTGEITARIRCNLGYGVAFTATPAKQGVSLNCSIYSSETKDACFLPVVSLIYPAEDPQQIKSGCSGTIIGARHILTAAHCLRSAPQFIAIGTAVFRIFREYEAIPPSQNFDTFSNHEKILFLNEQMTGNYKISSALLAISKFSCFKDKDCSSPQLDQKDGQADQNDLAIITVASPFPFPLQQQAVLVDTPELELTVNIAGFGPNPSNPGDFQQKRYASTRITSDNGSVITLASGEARRETCRGDSGSGAYVRLKNGRLGVFGVLSSGFPDCQQGRDSNYVSISYEEHLAFLNENVPDLIFENDPIYADDQRSRCIGSNCPSSLFDP